LPQLCVGKPPLDLDVIVPEARTSLDRADETFVLTGTLLTSRSKLPSISFRIAFSFSDP
jgi:hypothetical protein